LLDCPFKKLTLENDTKQFAHIYTWRQIVAAPRSFIRGFQIVT
jgi:hypothetical protein